MSGLFFAPEGGMRAQGLPKGLPRVYPAVETPG
jgi:hypothetical protein